jgi:hypothetical protein
MVCHIGHIILGHSQPKRHFWHRLNYKKPVSIEKTTGCAIRIRTIRLVRLLNPVLLKITPKTTERENHDDQNICKQYNGNSSDHRNHPFADRRTDWGHPHSPSMHRLSLLQRHL